MSNATVIEFRPPNSQVRHPTLARRSTERPTRTPVDLRLLVHGLVWPYSVADDRVGVDVRALIDPDLPSHVLLDERHVRTIVLHLLGNAVEATPAGRVRVVVSWDEGQVYLHVNDDGVGIPDRMMAELVQIFDGSAESPPTSGLALVHALAVDMGGTVHCASTPGEGSSFVVRLPCPAAA